MKFTTITAAAIVAALLFLAAAAGWRISNWYRSYCARRRMARGMALEKKAGALLQSKGYKLVAYQHPVSYEMVADGRTVTVSLRIDFIVSRNGKTYVAEVKSGKVASDIKSSATRRQLLEYGLAAQTDGTLLVDMESKEIDEIVFPWSGTSVSSGRHWLLWAIIAALLAWMFYWYWNLNTPDWHC